MLTLLVLLIEVTAPQLAGLLAGGFAASDPALITLTTQLIRLLAPVVWFLSLGGVAMAVLYALQRFTAPALATAIFNLGIVVTDKEEMLERLDRELHLERERTDKQRADDRKADADRLERIETDIRAMRDVMFEAFQRGRTD